MAPFSDNEKYKESVKSYPCFFNTQDKNFKK